MDDASFWIGTALGIAVAFAAIALLLRNARRRICIPVDPKMDDLPDIPPNNVALQSFTDRVVPQLRELGYERVAVIEARELSAAGWWMQALFMNREEPTRASIVCLRDDTVAQLDLLLATEFESTAGGGVVATAASDLAEARGIPVDQFPPNDVDARAMLELHGAAVTRYRAERVNARVFRVPKPGQEPDWLRDRARAVIAAICAKGYGFSRDGRWYVPTWRTFLLQGWQRSRLIRARKRALSAGPGFAVVMPRSE